MERTLGNKCEHQPQCLCRPLMANAMKKPWFLKAFTKKNQGLRAIRALEFEPNTQGLKVCLVPGENVDQKEIGLQIGVQSELLDSQNTGIFNDRICWLAELFEQATDDQQTAILEAAETIVGNASNQGK